MTQNTYIPPTRDVSGFNCDARGRVYIPSRRDITITCIAKNVSAALLALCTGFLTPPALIAWTPLSTQVDIHTTNVSYNFVTRVLTCQNLQAARINASKMQHFASKLQVGVQHGRIQVLHRNNYCHQCAIKCTAIHTFLTSRHMEVTQYYLEFLECQEIAHVQTVYTRPFSPTFQTGLGTRLICLNKRFIQTRRTAWRSLIKFEGRSCFVEY